MPNDNNSDQYSVSCRSNPKKSMLSSNALMAYKLETFGEKRIVEELASVSSSSMITDSKMASNSVTASNSKFAFQSSK